MYNKFKTLQELINNSTFMSKTDTTVVMYRPFKNKDDKVSTLKESIDAVLFVADFKTKTLKLKVSYICLNTHYREQ